MAANIGLPVFTQLDTGGIQIDIWQLAATGGIRSSRCQCSQDLKDSGRCCCSSTQSSGCCGNAATETAPLKKSCCAPESGINVSDVSAAEVSLLDPSELCGQPAQPACCIEQSSTAAPELAVCVDQPAHQNDDGPVLNACGCGCESKLSFLTCNDPRLVHDWREYLFDELEVERLVQMDVLHAESVQTPELPPPQFSC